MRAVITLSPAGASLLGTWLKTELQSGFYKDYQKANENAAMIKENDWFRDTIASNNWVVGAAAIYDTHLAGAYRVDAKSNPRNNEHPCWWYDALDVSKVKLADKREVAMYMSSKGNWLAFHPITNTLIYGGHRRALVRILAMAGIDNHKNPLFESYYYDKDGTNAEWIKPWQIVNPEFQDGVKDRIQRKEVDSLDLNEATKAKYLEMTTKARENVKVALALLNNREGCLEALTKLAKVEGMKAQRLNGFLLKHISGDPKHHPEVLTLLKLLHGVRVSPQEMALVGGVAGVWAPKKGQVRRQVASPRVQLEKVTNKREQGEANPAAPVVAKVDGGTHKPFTIQPRKPRNVQQLAHLEPDERKAEVIIKSDEPVSMADVPVAEQQWSADQYASLVRHVHDDTVTKMYPERINLEKFNVKKEMSKTEVKPPVNLLVNRDLLEYFVVLIGLMPQLEVYTRSHLVTNDFWERPFAFVYQVNKLLVGAHPNYVLKGLMAEMWSQTFKWLREIDRKSTDQHFAALATVQPAGFAEAEATINANYNEMCNTLAATNLFGASKRSEVSAPAHRAALEFAQAVSNKFGWGLTLIVGGKEMAEHLRFADYDLAVAQRNLGKTAQMGAIYPNNVPYKPAQAGADILKNIAVGAPVKSEEQVALEKLMKETRERVEAHAKQELEQALITMYGEEKGKAMWVDMQLNADITTKLRLNRFNPIIAQSMTSPGDPYNIEADLGVVKRYRDLISLKEVMIEGDMEFYGAGSMFGEALVNSGDDLTYVPNPVTLAATAAAMANQAAFYLRDGKPYSPQGFPLGNTPFMGYPWQVNH